MKDEIAARLRAIRGRTEAATDGPWLPQGNQYSGGYLGHVQDTKGEWLAQCWDRFEEDMVNAEANAAFIAAARDDVPYLLGVADAAAAFLGLFLADEGCGVDTCEAALTLLRAFGGETEGGGE